MILYKFRCELLQKTSFVLLLFQIKYNIKNYKLNFQVSVLTSILVFKTIFITLKLHTYFLGNAKLRKKN